MKNHENRIDFESISVACRQIELALVIYLRQFYAQQIFQVHCTLAQLLSRDLGAARPTTIEPT